MKRHSIRWRLSAVFTVFGLLLIVFGVFNIWRLGEVYDASAEIRDRWLISTRLLGDMNNATSDYRAAEPATCSRPPGAGDGAHGKGDPGPGAGHRPGAGRATSAWCTTRPS